MLANCSNPYFGGASLLHEMQDFDVYALSSVGPAGDDVFEDVRMLSCSWDETDDFYWRRASIASETCQYCGGRFYWRKDSIASATCQYWGEKHEALCATRPWSPSLHPCLPSRERRGYRALFVVLTRRCRLPEDVVECHVLPFLRWGDAAEVTGSAYGMM